MSKTKIGIFIILVLVFTGLLWSFRRNTTQMPEPDTSDGDTMMDETVSDGVIHVPRPDDFGLAVTDEQILVQSYIPPCDSGFDYCLYYNGNAYAGTNFESAGLAVRKRDDLAEQESCLATLPTGYSDLEPTTIEHESYSISVFSPVGDAAAGHYANGEEYRLYTAEKCYQFDVRIGESQYANYPEGSIGKFTDDDRDALFAKLRNLLSSTTLVASGTTLELPQ